MNGKAASMEKITVVNLKRQNIILQTRTGTHNLCPQTP
jgi:hypothetical protein